MTFAAASVVTRGWPSSKAPMSVADPSFRVLPSKSFVPFAASSTPASIVGEPACWRKSLPPANSGAALWLWAEPAALIEQPPQTKRLSKLE